jgi:UDP-N-acetylglucosamine 2-epimerase
LILVTAHRRENWGQPIRDIAQAVAQILTANEDAVVIWPVHPNPAVRADVEAVVVRLPLAVRSRICLTEPLGYQSMIALLDTCEFTLTDSGGIQEEASAFGKPVLVARKSTERQELVTAGGARLVGTDIAAIVDHSMALLTDAAFYRSMQLDKSPFGDGRSARGVVDILTETASLDEAAPTFAAPVHRAMGQRSFAAYA